jgi:hypothetical protein
MSMSREELVRIDDTGAIHPVGKVASQRMRARKGAFRLMPAPDHVIFIRYVGEDGERDDDDGAIVRLAGEVTAPGSLCDIVALVGQAGWKGELVVLSGETWRSLFFEAGNILGAQTNVVAERIGTLLYRLGVLSTLEVEQVERALTSGRRFGEVAVMLGLLTREKLFEVMAKQIQEIAFATLLVSDGMFYFLDRYDAARVAMRHHVSASSLLMEGVQRMDESKYFRERIPSDSHVPMLISGRSDPPEELAAVFRACDGKRSVLEVARSCGLGEFEVTRALFQLVQAGFVHVNPPMPEGPQALVSLFNEAISTIFHAADRAGKAHLVREHLGQFASSIGVYDALFAGAGPAADGRLDEARTVQNVKVLGGDDAEILLAQWLYEYAAFALFDAGSQLSKEDEQMLSKEVSDLIKVLAPKL